MFGSGAWTGIIKVIILKLLSTTQKTLILEKKCRVVRGDGWDNKVATCTVYHCKEYVSKSSYNDRGFRTIIINEE